MSIADRPSIDLEELELGNPETFDLADPRLHAEWDLHEFWRRVRDRWPIHWQPSAEQRPGFWVIARHADVLAVYRDAQRFSSERGNMLTSLMRPRGDPASGRMMTVTDGRRHAQLRQLALHTVSPRKLGPLALRVHQTASRLVDAAVGAGDVDVVSAIAAVIPLTTICELLGVPPADQAFLLAQTNAALGADRPDQRYSLTWTARNEILLYFTELAQQRRALPDNDVVSHLATSAIDGQPLSIKDVALNCYSLLLGGTETTGLALAGAVASLARHPQQWQRLREGRVDTAKAVEEVLRWTTPALHAGRTAVVDCQIGEVHIRAGDLITLWHASANRDERAFADPDEFDLGRSPNPHVSFGHGRHFCLGAQLARIEIGSFLDALRQQVSTIELAGGGDRVYSNFLSGWLRLPVRLTWG